jgi:hypothetical protein
MLNLILIGFVEMHRDRIGSGTVYCGNGTTVDTVVSEYLDNGGSIAIVIKVDAMAYARACAMQ